MLTWGDGSYDDFGHGNTLNKYTPRKIPGISNAVSISAGTGFSAAIKDDGTVWTWGNKDRGQLGRTDTSTKTPGQVTGLSEISKIACGENFIIALMDYDTIYSWGANTCGQLGDGTKADRITPAAVISSYSDISADREHVLAISGGKLYAWGQNSVGQLGLNDKIDRTTPTLVSSINGNVNSIRTGYNHSIAILSDGTLYTWGEERDGQLGNGFYLTKRIPTKVGSLSNIAMATGGKDFTLAIDKNGNMWLFGTNAFGQLGLGE